MGIRFFCPNGHKLNVKEFQAGRRGICPFCGARIQIPTQSTRPSSKSIHRHGAAHATTRAMDPDDAELAQASDSSPEILPGEPPSLPGDPAGGRMLGPSTAVGIPSGSGPVVAPPTLQPIGQNAAAIPTKVAADAGPSPRPGPLRPASPAPSLPPPPAASLPSVPGTVKPIPAAPLTVAVAPASPVPGPSVTAAAAAPIAAPAPSSPAAAESSDPIAEAPDMILVRAAAIGRAIRPGLRRTDEDVVERRPRGRRVARVARGLARLAGGGQSVSQAPRQPDHGFLGNGAGRQRGRCTGSARPSAQGRGRLRIAAKSPC